MIVTFASSKGGTGKTTLAFNVAVALNPTLCVDLDVGDNRDIGFTFVNGMRQQQTGKTLNVKQITDRESLVKIIKSDTDEQLILIDSGGLDYSLNRVAVGCADIVIYPSNDKALEINSLLDFDGIVTKMSDAAKRKINVHVIASRTNYAKKTWPDLQNACNLSKNMIFSGLSLPMYVDLSDSFGDGKAINEYAANSHANIHMQQIVNYIKQQLQQKGNNDE
jgi:ATPase MipZ.